MSTDEPIRPPITPYCVVNYEVAKRNADTMLARARCKGVELRPHVKTHKTVEGTLLMTGGRRSKIVVSTISELHFFIEAGFDDIVYAIPISYNRLETIAAYLQIGKDIKVVCDHPDQFQYIVQFAQQHQDLVQHIKFKVLLMLAFTDTCNVGESLMHAVGLDPCSQDSLELANTINKSYYATYEGLYIHAGCAYNAKGTSEIQSYIRGERDTVVTFAKWLKAEYNIESKHIGMGSTPTTSAALDDVDLKGITEIHAGNYLMYDTMQRDIGACVTSDMALTVRCTVVSVYSNSLLIDMGWTGNSAQGAGAGYGEIISHPELQIKSLKQETGEVVMKDSTESIHDHPNRYHVGMVLTVASYHACATAHQYRTIWVEEGGKLLGSWQRSPGH